MTNITTIRVSRSLRDYLKKKTINEGYKTMEEYIKAMIRDSGYYEEI